MHRVKLRINYIIACLTILFIFIPNEKIRIIYLTFLMALSFLSNKGIKNRVYKIGILRIIYAITFIASLFIHYYSGTLINCISFVFAFIVVRYLVMEGLSSEEEIERIISYILVLFTIYAVLGIIESLTQFNIFDSISGREIIMGGANEYRGIIFRNHGLCTVSINNSMILFIVWLLSSYKAFKYRNKIYIASFFLIGIDFLMVFSRLVMLVAAMTQIVLILSLKGRRRVRFWLTSFIIVALVFITIPSQIASVFEYFRSFFIPLIEEFIGGGFHGSGGVYHGGSGQRIALWAWVFAFIRGKLLFGIGFVNPFYHRFVDNGITKIKESVEVHWLYVLLQKGIFGLAGFICYQVYCLKTIIASYKKTNKKDTPNLALVFLLITLGYFISLFGCSGFEDLLFFYMIFSIFEAYDNIVSGN